MSSADWDEAISRRVALQRVLVPLTGIAAMQLFGGCSEEKRGASTEGAPDGQSPRDGDDASTKSSATPNPAADANVPWASGGTKAMAGGYPDPFKENPGTACMLTSAMILGPCYADTIERKDISEGMPGVPMRLSLLIVRADGCTPVPGATVDVWHACAGGYYSEFATGTACNPGTEDSTNVKFFRGVQTTDDAGRVDFDTVVPGWYTGRAVHVHVTVRENGDEYVTSQLFFDDALLDEIEKQVDYEARGPRDTRNTQDLVLPADDMSPFLLETVQRADGALHGWKVIALRSSLDETLPQAGGGFGMPGGDGGLPAGFPGGAPPAGGLPGGGPPPNAVPRTDGGGA